jgi:hypothetical protein
VPDRSPPVPVHVDSPPCTAAHAGSDFGCSVFDSLIAMWFAEYDAALHTAEHVPGARSLGVLRPLSVAPDYCVHS